MTSKIKSIFPVQNENRSKCEVIPRFYYETEMINFQFSPCVDATVAWIKMIQPQ